MEDRSPLKFSLLKSAYVCCLPNCLLGSIKKNGGKKDESTFRFMDLTNKFPDFKKLLSFRSFLLALTVVIISLGTIGGCNNNGGSGGSTPTHGVLIGDHRDEALVDIMAGMDVDFYAGKRHNMIIDGTRLDNLTNDEKDIIRDAYQNGFIILAYDMNDARVARLYNDILQHPSIFAELEDLSMPDGNSYEVFAIEKQGPHDWSFTGTSEQVDQIEFLVDGELSQLKQVERGPFELHAIQMREWIEAQEQRRIELELKGLLDVDASKALENFEILAEFEDVLEEVTRTSDQSGTLINLASAWIQTSQNKLSFKETDKLDTFQMVTSAWIATVDTPNGVFSFLCVAQDFNLATSNGFVKDTDTQQYWYLSQFSNTNTLSVSGTDLDSSKAELLKEQPDTNQATTTTESISVGTSVGGTVGVDSDGASASISGGMSWTTSTTFSKANVSINNVSLMNDTLSNDASWNYFPRPATPGPDDGCVNTIHDLADLAHTTFQPSQGYIYRIDSDFADQTLNLNTQFSIQTRNTYMNIKTGPNDCNIFHCNCDAHNQDGLTPIWQPTHSQPIHIPAEPDDS